MQISRPTGWLVTERGDGIVIKSSEFSTIAVLVAATAVVVAVQQHRERERRVPSPPAIEVESIKPTADARVISSTSAGFVDRVSLDVP